MTLDMSLKRTFSRRFSNIGKKFRSPTKSASSKADIDSGFDETQSAGTFTQIQIQIKETNLPDGVKVTWNVAGVSSGLRELEETVILDGIFDSNSLAKCTFIKNVEHPTIEHEQLLGEYLSGSSTIELEGHFFTVVVNPTKQSLATALIVANAEAMVLSSPRTRSIMNREKTETRLF
ncbi:Oidioi.mRNA.OKI2018_I69.chr1.g1429.t3.cds [Oikopleura dioica]|uniref:Oidioi.mRNA.OKI2018_I69.chr1.g1429.t3.cds n=1 Tax=Oikopleura dioica TaxID=34765 RepID=A0ABN7SPK1_OIKDI|nr:Oidioi.mRNA.OKI2018_I69.chr1.g1429.t3.cds [Oikopleura dioica]